MAVITENMQALQICGGNLVKIKPVITSDSRFIICSNGNNVNVYSIGNGERCRVFKGHKSKVNSLSQICDESSTVISGSEDGQMLMWSYEDGTIERTFQLPRPLCHLHLFPLDEFQTNSPIHGFGIIKKNDLQDYYLVKFELPQEEIGESLNTETLLEEFTCKPVSFGFGDRSSILATINSRRLQIFKIKTKELFSHKSKTKFTCVACHPNEKIVATGKIDGKILLWRDVCGSQPIVSEYHWHSLPVRTLHFTMDGATLYSGGYECVLVSWTLTNMKKMILPRLGSPICHLTSSHDGSLIAVCNAHNGIQIVDTSNKFVQVIQGFAQACKEIPITGTKEIHFDNRTGMIFFVGLPGQLQLYDPFKDSHVFNMDVTKQNYTTPENLLKPIPCTEITHVSLSEDGMWMATAQSLKYPNNIRIETALKFWHRNAGSFEFHGKYEMEDTTITSLASRNFKRAGFNPTFATTFSDGSFCTWEFNRDKSSSEGVYMWQHGFSGEYRKACNCSFSYDGSALGLVHDDCISLWNLVEGRREQGVSQYRDDETYRLLVFGQRFESNIFYTATNQSLACWSPKQEDGWSIPLQVTIMIGNPGTDELIAFTSDFKVNIYAPRSSVPLKSIELSSGFPIISACVKDLSLIFVNENHEVFTLSENDVEMDCDEVTESEPAAVSLWSQLATDAVERRKSKSSKVTVTKTLMLSDLWGTNFLETVTPRWKNSN